MRDWPGGPTGPTSQKGGRVAETEQRLLRRHHEMLAQGTPLRAGLERILRGRTGALIVVGRNAQLDPVVTGGFQLDTPFTPTALRELCKMDGAVIVSSELDQILAAGVHLMPDPDIETIETGTRHRTADRVARQTGLPVVTVSASMSTIALYLPDGRHVVEATETLLSRANQALQTFERYLDRFRQVTNRLSSLEVQDQVTVKDLALVAQRLELVRRLERELDDYVVQLGTDGRLLELQLLELESEVEQLGELLERDYRPEEPIDGFGIANLASLNTTDLLDPTTVARTIGFGPGDHLDTRLSTRGYRQLAQISRLPSSLGARLLEHFGSLQGLFGASSAELMQVEGVGEQRARMIRNGLIRLAESAYTDQLD